MVGATTNAVLQKFASLPGTDDPLFRQLWVEGRLQYRGQNQTADTCDEACARLACAAVRSCRPLLIELPDRATHRPALLFATGLLRFWWDWRHASAKPPAPVLYFGSHVGIREQLSQIRIVGMSVDLAGVFDEEHVTRRAGVAAHATPASIVGTNSQLPRVITIYAPADAAAAIERYRPGLIAIDLADSGRLDWLQPLLKCAAGRHIRTIAWGQNPLSNCAAEFSGFGHVFTWPPHVGGRAGVESLTNPPLHTVLPLLVGGAEAEEFSQQIRKAGHLLAFAHRLCIGRLAEHALAAHWSYLRFLEALHVPADLYEAEVPRMWGMKSLQGLRQGSRRFRETCMGPYPVLAAKLEEAASHLDKAHDLVSQGDSPLWCLLSNVCITEPASDRVRLLTFTSRARHELFTYAVLVRYNISPDDLRELRVVATTAEDVRSADDGEHDDWGNLKRTAVVVGLPGPMSIPKLLPVFLQDDVQMLIYPHQLHSLQRRISECGRRLQPQLSVISALSDPNRHLGVIGPQVSAASALVIGEPVVLEPGTVITRRAKKAELRLSDSTAEEVANLFEVEEEVDVGAAKVSGGMHEEEMPTESVWCEKAFEIGFSGGWVATFAPDAGINVVEARPSGQEAVLRKVEGLRPGQRVLFIQGQERQELYDLLVARLHRHPAFELHLALVKRWQDDLIDAFYRQSKIHSVSELLAGLQAATSSFSPCLYSFPRSNFCIES